MQRALSPTVFEKKWLSLQELSGIPRIVSILSEMPVSGCTPEAAALSPESSSPQRAAGSQTKQIRLATRPACSQLVRQARTCYNSILVTTDTLFVY